VLVSAYLNSPEKGRITTLRPRKLQPEMKAHLTAPKPVSGSKKVFPSQNQRDAKISLISGERKPEFRISKYAG
jgi:hypothetical protein